ncbi:uncharacterized protein LOC142324143 [Lycorma delicatula]|uniref:uncharacterized protein LOC142324143 n=1 Tax=Lycorma delicatula TaxID=130591 RepID=UPI003F50FEF3
MEHQRNTARCCLLVTILLITTGGVHGLRDVELKVPAAVSPGDTVTLICRYDLEGEPLYTVKWYKGREEFYRYIPKEHPHTLVFPLPAVNVDMSKSGADKVVLMGVSTELAGKYRCEVSADAPNFHTQVVSAHMQVVDKLVGDPELILEKSRYAVGDTLRGNCTSPPHIPPANVTVLLNGRKVQPSFLYRWKQEDGKSITRIGLESKVTHAGKLHVLCIADLYNVFKTQSEVTLEEDRPRLASVLGTRQSTSVGVGSGSSSGRGIFVMESWQFILLSVSTLFFSR